VTGELCPCWLLATKNPGSIKRNRRQLWVINRPRALLIELGAESKGGMALASAVTQKQPATIGRGMRDENAEGIERGERELRFEAKSLANQDNIALAESSVVRDEPRRPPIHLCNISLADGIASVPQRLSKIDADWTATAPAERRPRDAG
jgi:hypothetical protein